PHQIDSFEADIGEPNFCRIRQHHRLKANLRRESLRSLGRRQQKRGKLGAREVDELQKDDTIESCRSGEICLAEIHRMRESAVAEICFLRKDGVTENGFALEGGAGEGCLTLKSGARKVGVRDESRVAEIRIGSEIDFCEIRGTAETGALEAHCAFEAALVE